MKTLISYSADFKDQVLISQAKKLIRQLKKSTGLDWHLDLSPKMICPDDFEVPEEYYLEDGKCWITTSYDVRDLED